MLKHASKKKIWNIAADASIDECAKLLCREMGLSLAVSRLLAARGYTTSEAARDFIGKATELLLDPFLLRDMDKAVERIVRALNDEEMIRVYGDYDVDGVTSVTVLYKYLKSRGADVKYYIPNRIGEGYGVNPEALRGFVDEGVTLMITVDTGITAIDEIEDAKRLGLDTVVTDHHECRPELPDAVAVVNPCRPDCHYPFKELAGVGVAYKLICALEMKLSGSSFADAVRKVTEDYGDLVAIGTVADVMPLIGENRIIVSYGLHKLEDPSNIGIRALMQASGLTGVDENGKVIKKKITSAAIGFTLAPRINAAGRISSAEFAVELFITEDPVRADEIAAELCETNRRRQAEENSIMESAEEKIAKQCSEDDFVIVLDDDHWHHGVIGIVCSRLTEKYNLPSVLVSFEHNMGDTPSDSDMGKGSGRSIPGLNLFDALASCQELLAKYGGHELAAGLSVERGKLLAFRKAINEFAREAFGDTELFKPVAIDLKLYPEEISINLASELYCMEPFGVANSQPVFETDRMIITEITALAGGKHTKLTLRCAGLPTQFTALCFGTPSSEFTYSVGEAVDVVYNLDINEYRGRQSVQLLVRDIRLSVISETLTRDDFAAVYRAVRVAQTNVPVKADITSLSELSGISADKLCAVLDVFAELSMISLYRGEQFEVSILPTKGKTPLETSNIYKALVLSNEPSNMQE